MWARWRPTEIQFARRMPADLARSGVSSTERCASMQTCTPWHSARSGWPMNSRSSIRNCDDCCPGRLPGSSRRTATISRARSGRCCAPRSRQAMSRLKASPGYSRCILDPGAPSRGLRHGVSGPARRGAPRRRARDAGAHVARRRPDSRVAGLCADERIHQGLSSLERHHACGVAQAAPNRAVTGRVSGRSARWPSRGGPGLSTRRPLDRSGLLKAPCGSRCPPR